MEIRPLRESDDRSEFQSGDADLDRFFHHFAGQNQWKHHIGVTYVAFERRIVGYATVSPGHIEIEDLPAAARKKLPKYPLPILRLARLAVDASFRGQGLGRELLRFVLLLAVRMSGEVGCVGVVVDADDAKTDSVTFYERHGFLRIDAVEGQSDARPQPAAMFLSVRAIRASLHAGR